VIHSYAGYENKVKTNLESRIASLNMEDYIFQVEVPMEEVTEIKNGQRKLVKRRNKFPGTSWSAWTSPTSPGGRPAHPGVTGFVGTGTSRAAVAGRGRRDPRPDPEKKPAARPATSPAAGRGRRLLRRRLGHRHRRPVRDAARHHLRDQRRRQKVTGLVEIFGRETPVELGFSQIQKN
jgi:transcription termination/antitermination protein NusG